MKVRRVIFIPPRGMYMTQMNRIKILVIYEMCTGLFVIVSPIYTLTPYLEIHTIAK